MTKKLRWRLKTLPTVDELRALVGDKFITQEEAKEILFSSDDSEGRDVKSLESEIKFLRELVEKLSSSRNKVVEVIKEVYRPYYQYHWYQPYQLWCSSISTTYNQDNMTGDMTGAGIARSNSVMANQTFSSIKTF